MVLLSFTISAEQTLMKGIGQMFVTIKIIDGQIQIGYRLLILSETFLSGMDVRRTLVIRLLDVLPE